MRRTTLFICLFILAVGVSMVLTEYVIPSFIPTAKPKWGIVIMSPTTADDFHFTKIEEDIVIKKVDGLLISGGAAMVTGYIDKCNPSGDGCTAMKTDVFTFDGGLDTITSINFPTATNGQTLRWRTDAVTGSPTYLMIIIHYRVTS